MHVLPPPPPTRPPPWAHFLINLRGLVIIKKMVFAALSFFLLRIFFWTKSFIDIDYSGAQPSTRGHFFARRAFLECPQTFFKHFCCNLTLKNTIYCAIMAFVRHILPVFKFLSAIFARHHFLTKIFARCRKRLGTAGILPRYAVYLKSRER